MAAPENPPLGHRMRPPDIGRATGHAAANDQDGAVHDFNVRPIHRIPPAFACIAGSSGAGCRQPIHGEILRFAKQRDGLEIEIV